MKIQGSRWVSYVSRVLSGAERLLKAPFDYSAPENRDKRHAGIEADCRPPPPPTVLRNILQQQQSRSLRSLLPPNLRAPRD